MLWNIPDFSRDSLEIGFVAEALGPLPTIVTLNFFWGTLIAQGL